MLFWGSWHRSKNFPPQKPHYYESLTHPHAHRALCTPAAHGKYFNLIIWQHTKTCHLMKSLASNAYYRVIALWVWCCVPIFRRLSLFRYCFYAFFSLPLILRCPSSVTAFQRVYFFSDEVTTNRILASKFSALCSSNTTIYSFQCFNDVKLWIYCVCVCKCMMLKIGSENPTA